VAGIFVLHPLNVQSVAWITERKGLLSTCFWFATAIAYLKYVRRPQLSRYVVVAALFSLALMSKGVAVTLPFALLLLDIWPLRRISLDVRPKASILWEKLPLISLSILVTVVGYVTQLRAGATSSSYSLPLSRRFGNAIESYVVYILTMFWPTRLAAFYPYDLKFSLYPLIGSALVLLIITLAAVRWARARPWFAVGWFWYVGALLPMIGLAQLGAASRADRYTYLPAVGIWIMLAWGMAELAGNYPRLKVAIAGLAGACCVACLVVTSFNVAFWENSVTLFRHAIAVTTDNWLAYNNLGVELRKRGQFDEAIASFTRAAEILPGYVDPRANLTELYSAEGRYDEAVHYGFEALALDPDRPEVRVNLGSALGATGRLDEAEIQFRAVIRMHPEDPKAHNDLGLVLVRHGNVSEALEEFSTAIRLKPDYGDAEFNLGAALANSGHLKESVAHFSEALRIHPGDPRANQALRSVEARLHESDMH